MVFFYFFGVAINFYIFNSFTSRKHATKLLNIAIEIVDLPLNNGDFQ